MVARALWSSKACKVCLGRRPCTSYRPVQGCNQDTTPSASDHSARVIISNYFYNMDYEMINKIRQIKAWNEADTPNQYHALANQSI